MLTKRLPTGKLKAYRSISVRKEDAEVSRNQKKSIALEHFDYINYLLKIRCDCAGEIEKDILDKAILNELLPSESNLRWFTEQILFPLDDSTGTEKVKSHVSAALAAILEGISSGAIKTTGNEDAIRELLSYARTSEFRVPSSIIGQQRVHHFNKMCESFLDLVEKINDNDKAKQLKLSQKTLRSDTKRLLEDVIVATKDNASEYDAEALKYSPYLSMLFDIVSEYWTDVLQFNSREVIDTTFRMLIDICYMSNWDDSMNHRYELLEVMKKFK